LSRRNPAVDLRQATEDCAAARHNYDVNLRTQLAINRLQGRFDRLLE